MKGRREPDSPDSPGSQHGEAVTETRLSPGVLGGVIDGAPGLFWVLDEAGKLLCWNRETERATGCDAGLLQHMAAVELVDVADRPGFEHALSEAFVQGFARVEARLSRGAAGSLPCLFEARRLELEGTSGMAVVGLDISERVRTQVEHVETANKLKEAEVLLRTITEALPVGLLVLDNRSDEVVFFNHRLCQIWEIEHLAEQMASGRIKNREVLEVVVQRVQNVDSFLAGSLRLHDPSNRMVLQDEVSLKNGSTLRRFSSQVRDAEERYLGRMYMFEDITEKRRIEAQFRQAQKMESVGRLAGGIAHDFNNLLTVILGNCALLLGRGTLSTEARESIEEVNAAAERSAVLTRELLAFSRKQQLSPMVLDLSQVIGGVRNILDRVLGDRIRVVLRAEPNLWHVRADRGQLEQVILNLVVNGRDAMPEGGELTLETRNVAVTRGAADDAGRLAAGEYVMLSVTDTGYGIDPAVRERIFEPFFTTKALGQGTGLGLATVYGIVKQSGGEVVVRSEPGRGATFEVYLPRSRQETGGARRGGSEPAPSRGETVLLVEDNAMVRASVRSLLESLGYHAVVAGSADEALQAHRAQHDAIDLVMTDMVMPDRGGAELAADLRREGFEGPVVFMSGFNEEGAEGSWLEQADVFLHKPFSPAELSRCLRRALDRTARGSPRDDAR